MKKAPWKETHTPIRNLYIRPTFASSRYIFLPAPSQKISPRTNVQHENCDEIEASVEAVLQSKSEVNKINSLMRQKQPDDHLAQQQ
jgi:hypothetical protein